MRRVLDDFSASSSKNKNPKRSTLAARARTTAPCNSLALNQFQKILNSRKQEWNKNYNGYKYNSCWFLYSALMMHLCPGTFLVKNFYISQQYPTSTIEFPSTELPRPAVTRPPSDKECNCTFSVWNNSNSHPCYYSNRKIYATHGR